MDEHYDTFKYYEESHHLNPFGASICTVLHQYCPSSTGSRTTSRADSEIRAVCFHSIEALITKDPPPSTDKSKSQQGLLNDGFQQPYIDPHGFVEKIAERLREHMKDYLFQKKDKSYVAPYTSLVTSSMMGKSRLMKELARVVPIVYICVRDELEDGFPKATTGIPMWFNQGACGDLSIQVTQPDIQSDADYIIPTLRHSLFLLNLLKNLRELIVDLNKKSRHRYPSLRGHITLSKSSFEWMWDFFADYREPYVSARGQFWDTVKTQTHDKFFKLRAEAAGSESAGASEWASDYLTNAYEYDLEKTNVALRGSLQKLCKDIDRTECDELPIVICFDEARNLCTTSAVTGEKVVEEGATGATQPDDVDTRRSGYSNFRAMRRALGYLRLAKRPPPRAFGLFTDTTSRLTNLQPRRKDEKSKRLLNLPAPGKNHFDPVHVFTSIDAHAMILEENNATADHLEVAKVERLLKFGRAGWYSLYSAKKAVSPKVEAFSIANLLNIAMSKLLGGIDEPVSILESELPSDKTEKMPPGPRLRLLAVAACRLALAVGPFSTEARDLVSSHLAILLSTDLDCRFLKIYYPSEPILAEASAGITAAIGWTPALQALYHYLQNGIVNMGYRGELLSKVLCLMAMDRIKKPFSLASNPTYWRHTQPVKTGDFLDGWLAPPDGYSTFTGALLKSNHRTDATELERFLDGYVSFYPSRSHFVSSSDNSLMESGRGDNVPRKHTLFRPRYSGYARAREGSRHLWGLVRGMEYERVETSMFKCFFYPHQFEELHRCCLP
jgi:hypothetical protein